MPRGWRYQALGYRDGGVVILDTLNGVESVATWNDFEAGKYDTIIFHQRYDQFGGILPDPKPHKPKENNMAETIYGVVCLRRGFFISTDNDGKPLTMKTANEKVEEIARRYPGDEVHILASIRPIKAPEPELAPIQELVLIPEDPQEEATTTLEGPANTSFQDPMDKL